MLTLHSLLASYNEFANTSTSATLARHRSSGTIWKTTPDVFPTTYPFALVSDLPPLSLFERHQEADVDGLSDSGTFNCGLVESAIVIFTLVLAAPRTNLFRYLTEILELEGTDTCAAILTSLFEFGKSVMRFDAFPRQWLTLSLMCLSAINRLMDPIAELLEREVFIPPVRDADTFDVQLWTRCFELLCDLCGSEELALTDQTQQRRRAAWIIAGDLGDHSASLLFKLWTAIGWPLTETSDSGGFNDFRVGGVSACAGQD